MADDLDVLLSWTRAGNRGQENQDRIVDLANFIADVGLEGEDRYNRQLDANRYPPSDIGFVAHEEQLYHGLLSPQGIGIPHVVQAPAPGKAPAAWDLFKNPTCFVKSEMVKLVAGTQRHEVLLDIGPFSDPAIRSMLGMGVVAARFSKKIYDPNHPILPPPTDGWPSLSEPILQNPDAISEGTYQTAISTTARIFIETPESLHGEQVNADATLELSISGRVGASHSVGIVLSPRLTWAVTRSAERYVRSAQRLTPANHLEVPRFSMSIGKGVEDPQDTRTWWTPFGTNATNGKYPVLHQAGARYSRALPKTVRADIRLSSDLRFNVDKDGKIVSATVLNPRFDLFAA